VRNATRKFQNFREVHINRVHSNTADVSTVFRNKKRKKRSCSRVLGYS
jgi:hypothetical protein